MNEELRRVQQQDKADKAGYDDLYGRESAVWSRFPDLEAFVKHFSRELSPYFRGGNTKGYVRGLATQTLLNRAQALRRPFDTIRIVDAGFGEGKLSIYLAAQGFRVIGVDISEAAAKVASAAAQKLGVNDRCQFLAESLERTSIGPASIDFVIGHASLHHFIKYAGVPREFMRIMKPGAEGFFADSFSENRLYHLFQDHEKMRRLGDVRLTKALIEDYFAGFEPQLVPTDWFVMLDKLFLKALPGAMRPLVARLSRVNFAIDRRMPVDSRVALYLAGGVFTWIRRPAAP